MKIPVTITKAELKDVIKLRGRLNQQEIRFDGYDKPYEPEQLVFLGFQGSGDSNVGFSGHYVFREAKQSDEDRDSICINDLPGIESKEE